MPAVVSFWATQCCKLLSWTHHFRCSGRCWTSPLEKALKDHMLGSGNDIKAMVLQWYHHQPREFCWEDADISI